MPSIKNVLASFAIAASIASAHPGHDIRHEILERREFLASSKRSNLAHCADKLKARGIEARNVARRAAKVDKARQKRSLKKRDADEVLNKSHNKTELGYTANTDPATLFAGYNSCLLTADVTQGPYYVAGEYVRENIAEDQEGVSLLLDYQVVDVETCDPVPELYLEIWHCNSTGVYSGVVANGNGDSSDESNINETWLRGIQKTDSDGVAQFETIFPGHYTSRAIHIHVMAHANATLQANQTLGRDNYASHVGQTFFDQDLISAVELEEPYASNTQELTLNKDDGILSEEASEDGIDPFMEYTLLGDSVSDGIFAWLAFGVNTTASSSINPAVYYYKEGGVANGNSGAGGPGGAGGPPGGDAGGPPSGFSTGVAPSATPSAAADSCSN
ncbi:hypothetical protein FLONG3_10887 [Fusarium longipes]|uniref:Intradiol ring-cleavage dioxygenases domain-containing protein n=1 Tax=Fusarium longipes TaxID=694270 RepID=A0A395RK03_9HYPO|nr:hypothetical protein FLONG3_10887 [Fusarium longipes]